MFKQFNIETKTDYFTELSTSVKFEPVIKGRQGTVLVDYSDNTIPIVRTTTKYDKPAQKFLPIHYNLIKEIKNEVKENIELKLNNALIEIYDNTYRTMGYHSDQALDLKDDSYICIFSCYDNPNTKDIRKLRVKNKTTKEMMNYELNHNSILLFSLKTNQNHLHKIILDKVTDGVKWLGVTFRLSKTFIEFIDKKPYFTHSKKLLTIANDDKQKEFYKMRSTENKSIDYKYPDIEYSISISDLMLIE
jgi:hypothetical protein